MQDSIFTKIIKDEIPCHKVYEDETSLAFLDIHPIQEGQVLVIPKKQVGFVWDLEPNDYANLMATVQKVGKRLREIFPDKQRVGIIVEGLDVADHAHVKVFPFTGDAEFRHLSDKTIEPDHTALAELAKRIAFSSDPHSLFAA